SLRNRNAPIYCLAVVANHGPPCRARPKIGRPGGSARGACTVASMNAASFDTAADDVFGRIAGRYDLLCDLFSLGIHRYWKRRVAALIVARPWGNMLDAAAGTGDVALRVVGRDPALARRDIVVSDLSPAMLRIAERRIRARAGGLAFRVMDAHALAEIADA